MSQTQMTTMLSKMASQALSGQAVSQIYKNTLSEEQSRARDKLAFFDDELDEGSLAGRSFVTLDPRLI